MLSPGNYTLEELLNLIKDPVITIKLAEETGIVTIIVKNETTFISLYDGLDSILGFSEMQLPTGKHVGRRPAYLPNPSKLFYIYLDQISTSSNLVDGAPSTLLAIAPAAPGARDLVSIDYPSPIYKKLQVGDIYQLNLRV